VIPTYGLSEAGSGVTALPTAEARLAPSSAGRPLPGVGVTIDSPDSEGIGEIVVRSPAGFSGSVGERPRDPGAPIHTGDLGRLDEAGRLVVIDRRTDRIVRGGENVSPVEVEAALLAHPALADAAVVAVPDPLWGQVPMAAVVLRPGAIDPGEAGLTAHCRSLLAGFKVPAAFLRLDALPRTSGGKLQRDVVRAFVDGSPAGQLARPDGDRIGWRVSGSGASGTLPLILLPGTLSTAAQMDRLAGALAAVGDVTVHALDRRGSGTSRRASAGPLDVATHVEDLAAYLDARGLTSAVIVGSSFGGVLALELAARQPGRARAVIAYEPPYGPLADPATQARFAGTAARTMAAYAVGGSAAAAETFLRAVSGDAAWEALSDRSRAFLAAEGDGAVADSALAGLDPDGLARISAPVLVLTGGAGQPFYGPIADALVARLARARRVTLDGLTHTGPITDAARVAGAIRAFLVDAGLLSPDEPARASVETAP
jgi:pimeloyl-ACP methyl ester carboxylesterase